MGLFRKPNVEKMKAKNDVKGLIKALTDKDIIVKRGAAMALGDMKEAMAVESLILTLKDEDGYVRGNAAKALGQIMDSRALVPLCQTLKDELDYARICAVGAIVKLAKAGDIIAVEPLSQALKDENNYVRSDAARALEKIGDGRRAAVNALEEKKYVKATQMKGITLLIEICKKYSLLDTQSMWDEAVEDLKQHGERGSHALASLLTELLRCRAGMIGTVIKAAKEVSPVPELISALEAIKSASPLAPAPASARFWPHILGAGKVGWADGEAARIKELASEALNSLKR